MSTALSQIWIWIVRSGGRLFLGLVPEQGTMLLGLQGRQKGGAVCVTCHPHGRQVPE